MGYAVRLSGRLSLGGMDNVPASLRQLLATGPLATVVTIDPDGTPHVSLSWAGFDGDEIVMATFFNLGQRKLENLRRDPRVVLSYDCRSCGQGSRDYGSGGGYSVSGGALDISSLAASNSSWHLTQEHQRVHASRYLAGVIPQ
jgi:Pyridoxamine 5'-phosphate oxidase